MKIGTGLIRFFGKRNEDAAWVEAVRSDPVELAFVARNLMARPIADVQTLEALARAVEHLSKTKDKHPLCLGAGLFVLRGAKACGLSFPDMPELLNKTAMKLIACIEEENKNPSSPDFMTIRERFAPAIDYLCWAAGPGKHVSSAERAIAVAILRNRHALVAQILGRNKGMAVWNLLHGKRHAVLKKPGTPSRVPT